MLRLEDTLCYSMTELRVQGMRARGRRLWRRFDYAF